MADSRPLLLFFSSSRSGPSRRMESLVAHVARKERSRVRVVQVDVEERAELAARLEVARTPTLVLVTGRRTVGRIEGRASAPAIEALLDRHLAPAV
ncbi:MAG TPA: thioredoxin family protein [Gaiellaceae bacterium]|nr:thioredoxin family protein [Gaiellaceae bacterium]